jgi:uncharacterized protein involved in outer membrane biogenesis
MAKKIAIGVAVLVLVSGLGLYLWASSVFGQDTVRVAIAAQISDALGQPVTIGSIGAGIYPRVTLRLGDVTIGEPARIRVRALDVGTDFRALLSRSIEHADLHLNGARIELPLPPLALGSGGSAGGSSSSAPVRLVSIDEVMLKGVEIVSGGRTMIGDVDIVPQGSGATIRNITLKADDTVVTATGTINDLSGPIGNLTIKSGTLNVDRLVAFANDFAAGAGLASAPKQPAAPAQPTTAKAPAANLLMSLAADRATMGGLAVDDLVGRATLIGSELNLKPLAFKMFGGQYDGGITVALGDHPSFHWKAGIAGLDVDKAATFAGSPRTISGKLAATIDITGHGADAATALKTARGAARIDIANGVINNLGLVRAVVAATTLDKAAVQQAASGPRDEPFTRLGGTLTIANGSASTQDLRLESKDLTVAAAGALKVDGTAIDMRGDVQLSPELSKQAAGTLVRVSQQDGKVTLPLTIKGAAGSYGINVDASAMAKRAITNEINDQAQKAMKKGLGGLFKK